VLLRAFVVKKRLRREFFTILSNPQKLLWKFF